MEHLEHGSGLGTGLGRARAGDVVNHYRALDVDQNATRIQIREAYIRLKSTYGAGSAALYSLISEEEAREQLSRVEEAFRILSDDATRREHDQRLGIGRPQALPVEAQLKGGLLWDAAPVADTEGDENVVRTTRSTLPVIKLKAGKVPEEVVKERYAKLLAECDAGDGDLYRRLREAAEVSEDELQERTKVSIGYLRAIESNRFERLPQAVYVKGFLRSCFRYLAVPDAERLIAAFSGRLTDWQANKKT